MADRPLRPATHRSLGEPLPHQQANGPRAHLDAEAEASFPLAGTSGISPSFLGLSRSSRQVTHVLLTRSRLCPRASPGSSLHLHVLSTPPAFVLSQDQTLREELHEKLSWAPPAGNAGSGILCGLYTAVADHDGYSLLDSLPAPGRTSRDGWRVEPGRTPRSNKIAGAHAVEFSKTAEPREKGAPPGRVAGPASADAPRANQEV